MKTQYLRSITEGTVKVPASLRCVRGKVLVPRTGQSVKRTFPTFCPYLGAGIANPGTTAADPPPLPGRLAGGSNPRRTPLCTGPCPRGTVSTQVRRRTTSTSQVAWHPRWTTWTQPGTPTRQGRALTTPQATHRQPARRSRSWKARARGRIVSCGSTSGGSGGLRRVPDELPDNGVPHSTEDTTPPCVALNTCAHPTLDTPKGSGLALHEPALPHREFTALTWAV